MRKPAEPKFHLTTNLGADAHARRHRLQDATSWSAAKLITEALQVLEPQIIKPASSDHEHAA
jgi:hypothetical protein